LNPLAAPVDVLLVINFVIVDVVVVADVERWIRKGKIDGSLFQFLHALDAVAVLNL